SHKVSVVREEQLEDVKSKMSLMVSVHVYSVQKAALKDSGPLYSVDYDAVKDNLNSCSRYSAIKCAEAVPVSPAEARHASNMPEVSVPEPHQNTAPSSVNGHGNLTSKAATKPKGIMGIKPAAKSNPMRNFFGNQATKVKEEATSTSSVEAKPVISPPQKKLKETEPKETKPKEAQPKETKPKETQSKETKSKATQPKEIKAKETQPKEAKETEPKVAKQDSRSKSKRKEPSDSEEDEMMEKKKRRRIKKPQSDSSDDDD
ncbi:hypothetical protein CRUP_018213, partial [Coryphaenoides rupestris]